MPKHNKNQLSLRYMYSQYKKTVTDPVDYATHKKVLEIWGKKVCEFLLKGKDVRLHKGLSILGIRKRKQSTYVDRKASKEQGRMVIKPNSHSGFYQAKVYWRKNYARVSTKGWSFRPSRELARALAKVMQEPHGHAKFVERASIKYKK